MTYIANLSRWVYLYIGGVNYQFNVLDIQLSDDSALANGIVTTNGTITLGDNPGGPSVHNYGGQFFRRGTSVQIRVEYKTGTIVTHPRGQLYVVDTQYDIEENKLNLDVGCKLYLASITDDITNLEHFSSFTLPSDRKTFSDLSNALQAETAFIWQDNTGSIRKSYFFAGDGLGARKEYGDWTSILGETAISAESLGGGTLPPDILEVAYEYSVPSDSDIDPASSVDVNTTTLKYTIDFPAIEYERLKPEDGLTGTEGPSAINQLPPDGGRSSDACGASPATPSDPETDGDFEECTKGYNAVETVRLVDVQSTETTTNYYQGPGRQVSRITRELYNSALEHNPDYWKDYVEYCRFAYGTECRPDGNCLDNALRQGNRPVRDEYVVETNTYGEGGILSKKVVETYTTMMDCYLPVDWRVKPIVVFGRVIRTDFIPLHLYTGRQYEYMMSRVETEYQYYDSHTVEKTTTWTSDCGKEGKFFNEEDKFLRRIIDAYPGGKKRVVTKISSNKTPEREDQKSSDATTVTKSDKIIDVRSSLLYIEPPAEAGPIIMQTSVPFPLQGGSYEATKLAQNYTSYYRRYLEGDNQGIRVIEALRADIMDNWRPGMPFRFYDPRYGKIIALRMNSCSWAMSQNEAIISTDGIFVGISNGEISSFVNSENQTVPSIAEETNVVSIESISEVIKVNISLAATQVNGAGGSETGVFMKPDPETLSESNITLVAYVSGGIFEANTLLAADSNGGVPIANGSTLMTTSSIPIIPDLFA